MGLKGFHEGKEIFRREDVYPLAVLITRVSRSRRPLAFAMALRSDDDEDHVPKSRRKAFLDVADFVFDASS